MSMFRFLMTIAFAAFIVVPMSAHGQVQHGTRSSYFHETPSERISYYRGLVDRTSLELLKKRTPDIEEKLFRQLVEFEIVVARLGRSLTHAERSLRNDIAKKVGVENIKELDLFVWKMSQIGSGIDNYWTQAFIRGFLGEHQLEQQRRQREQNGGAVNSGSSNTGEDEPSDLRDADLSDLNRRRNKVLSQAEEDRRATNEFLDDLERRELEASLPEELRTPKGLKPAEEFDSQEAQDFARRLDKLNELLFWPLERGVENDHNSWERAEVALLFGSIEVEPLLAEVKQRLDQVTQDLANAIKEGDQAEIDKLRSLLRNLEQLNPRVKLLAARQQHLADDANRFLKGEPTQPAVATNSNQRAEESADEPLFNPADFDFNRSQNQVTLSAEEAEQARQDAIASDGASSGETPVQKELRIALENDPEVKRLSDERRQVDADHDNKRATAKQLGRQVDFATAERVETSRELQKAIDAKDFDKARELSQKLANDNKEVERLRSLLGDAQKALEESSARALKAEQALDDTVGTILKEFEPQLEKEKTEQSLADFLKRLNGLEAGLAAENPEFAVVGGAIPFCGEFWGSMRS